MKQAGWNGSSTRIRLSSRRFVLYRLPAPDLKRALLHIYMIFSMLSNLSFVFLFLFILYLCLQLVDTDGYAGRRAEATRHGHCGLEIPIRGERQQIGPTAST
jgi:hypothetical protein